MRNFIMGLYFPKYLPLCVCRASAINCWLPESHGANEPVIDRIFLCFYQGGKKRYRNPESLFCINMLVFDLMDSFQLIVLITLKQICICLFR